MRGRERIAWGATALAIAVFTGGAVAALTAIDQAATGGQPAARGEQMPAGPPPPAPATATYRITLDQVWSSTTHPTTLPPGWHTSPPVLAVHGAPGAMFARGSIASTGVESMAEVGATSALVSELRSNPSVGAITTGRRVDGVGSQTFELAVSQDRGLLSIVTMLAPSPDWFVGIDGLELFDGRAWVQQVSAPLAAYDAGTDSGATFVAANADTQPKQTISGPRDAEFQAANAEGAFVLVTAELIGP